MQQPYSEENAHKPTPPRAVSLCGEEISKGKLGSAIVTMDACNSEKSSDLNIETPDDMESWKETFLTGFSQHNKTF